MNCCADPVTARERRGVIDRLDVDEWHTAVRRHELYRHKKGGIYRRVGEARSEDGPMTIYEHIWPHRRALWVRPTAEFRQEDRFARIAA